VIKNYGQEDDLILIGSGIQFLMNNRIVNAEHWSHTEVKLFAELLNNTLGDQASKVIFLSGDVHHG